MNERIPYCFSNDHVTIMLDRPVTVMVSDRKYARVLKGLKDGVSKDEMRNILDKDNTESYIKEVNSGKNKIEVTNNKVFLNGEELHDSISKRIIQFIEEGLPFEHMLNFIRNIKENPSYSSQQELYDFLEHKDLPITDDGYFLAYKSVTPDFKDWHTNSVDNSIGAKPEMPRGNVDDDRNARCSKGYHAGSIEYVKHFNPHGNFIIVKIHPKDVVCVPKDYNCQKVRICKYEVIKVMEKIFDKPLYTGYGDDYYNSPEDMICWDEIDSEYSDEDIDSSWDDEYDDEYDDEDDDWSDTDEDYPLPKKIL